MGRGVGRPVAAVVLSEAERAYLERRASALGSRARWQSAAA